jgi:Mn-dependent DtxR family transcriptional regulator
MHTTQERMCRWLLTMHDRADGEELAYTHASLAAMMGVSLKSVTDAARALQTEGLIHYRRGKMQVLDRPSLEEASCECYGVIKKRFSAFLKPPPCDGRT